MMRHVDQAWSALSRPAALLGLMVVTLVLAAGLTYLHLNVESGPEAIDNHAFIDADATSQLVDTATAVVDQVFSLDPRRPKVQAKLVGQHLTAEAEADYRALYEAYLEQGASGISLTTTTTGVGVIRLRGDQAEVLVVADQIAAAPDGRSNSGTASFRLTMSKGSGGWQITSIDLV